MTRLVIEKPVWSVKCSILHEELCAMVVHTPMDEEQVYYMINAGLIIDLRHDSYLAISVCT